MTFLKTLFRNTKADRANLKRYVDMEYRPAEREAAYTELLRESGLR